MNSRERLLAMVVLGIVVLAGGALMAHQFVLVPLDQKAGTIAVLKKDIEDKQERIRQVQALKPKLDVWRQLSLPANVDLARRDYEKYLSALLRRSGFTAGSFSVIPKPADSKTAPTLPGKKDPIYTRLTFLVQAHGKLDSLVAALERFYQTSLLHQIKTLSIQRPLTAGPQQRPDELDVNFTVEAVIITGAGNRETLLPGVDRKLLALDVVAALRGGPVGLGLTGWAAGVTGPLGPRRLATPPRQYAAIAGKNIFFGPPPPPAPVARGETVDVTQYVHLTDITHSDRRTEAFLYDRYNNRKTRLRSSAGFNSFRILDDEGEPLLNATMLRIDDREVIFRAEDKYYTLHVGQSLQEALDRPLKPEEIKGLGLAQASESEK